MVSKALEKLPDALLTLAVKPVSAGRATLTWPLARSESTCLGATPWQTTSSWPDAVFVLTRSENEPSARTWPLATSTSSEAAARPSASISPDASLNRSVSQPMPATR